jgi:hypothetical protein
MRADSLVPRQAAIAPYEVTRPLGICRATSNTSSKKELSFLPEGVTVVSFSRTDGLLFFLGVAIVFILTE